MDNRNKLQRRIEGAIAENEAKMLRVINRPIVFSESDAQLIGEGIQKFMALPKDERKKLEELTAEQILKGWEDGEIKAMAQAIQDSLGLVFDALTGQVEQNRFFKTAALAGSAKKSIHTHIEDPNLGVQRVDLNMMSSEAAGLDLGWQQAFRSVDATNSKLLELMDMNWAVRFLEYANQTDPIQIQTMGSEQKQRETQRYFAAGFAFNERDFRFSAFDINQVLSAMRAAAVATITRLAYREIFTYKFDGTVVAGKAYSYSDNDQQFAAPGTDDLTDWEHLVFQARETLNEVHRKMVDEAAQIQNGKKRTRSSESPLMVSATDPILFYYNHKHRSIIEAIQRPSLGVDRILPTLYSNIVFVETAQAPLGGGYDVTDSREDRDDFGFFGSLKDSFLLNTIGGMAVIPGRRNISANFRNLTFLNDRNALTEATTIGAKLEHRFLMDKRQKWHVTLGAYAS